MAGYFPRNADVVTYHGHESWTVIITILIILRLKMEPGMLLECAGFLDDNDVRQGIVFTNSGIKVKKRDSVRVTVAHHGWDAVDDKVVYHPSKTNGRSVGNVVQQTRRGYWPSRLYDAFRE